MLKSILKSRFIKFAVVGLSGTIVDVGVSNLLRFVFNLAEIPSITISFVLAVLNNFHWNRIWTYPELKDKQTAIQLIKFTAISVIGYLIRTPIFTILENPILDFLAKIVRENFPVDLELIAHNISLAIVIIIVLFWNYFANRFWTYRELLKGDENEIESS